MRALIQRVTAASVNVDGNTVGNIDEGLLVYLGICRGDTTVDVDYIAGKIVGLRIFDDEQGKMNLNVIQVDAGLLVVSQFTLCASTRKGTRLSYINAALPDEARAVYGHFVDTLSRKRNSKISTGVFQAHMHVKSINDGPVTIMLDSKNR
ncbi:MAG: D-aminoacyl-tRNA deacylase [Nonlabens sp.]